MMKNTHKEDIQHPFWRDKFLYMQSREHFCYNGS